MPFVSQAELILGYLGRTGVDLLDTITATSLFPHLYVTLQRSIFDTYNYTCV